MTKRKRERLWELLVTKDALLEEMSNLTIQIQDANATINDGHIELMRLQDERLKDQREKVIECT